MILPILQHPDARLAQVAEDAVPGDAAIELLTDMVQTMFAHNGLGLAAPQVGHNVRAVCVFEKLTGNTYAILNPKIVRRSPHVVADYEGCLSVERGQKTVRVKRRHSVIVEGVTGSGLPMRISAAGQLARTLQHELDHLDGRTIADVTPPRKKRHLTASV